MDMQPRPWEVGTVYPSAQMLCVVGGRGLRWLQEGERFCAAVIIFGAGPEPVALRLGGPGSFVPSRIGPKTLPKPWPSAKLCSMRFQLTPALVIRLMALSFQAAPNAVGADSDRIFFQVLAGGADSLRAQNELFQQNHAGRNSAQPPFQADSSPTQEQLAAAIGKLGVTAERFRRMPPGEQRETLARAYLLVEYSTPERVEKLKAIGITLGEFENMSYPDMTESGLRADLSAEYSKLKGVEELEITPEQFREMSSEKMFKVLSHRKAEALAEANRRASFFAHLTPKDIQKLAAIGITPEQFERMSFWDMLESIARAEYFAKYSTEEGMQELEKHAITLDQFREMSGGEMVQVQNMLLSTQPPAQMETAPIFEPTRRNRPVSHDPP